LHNEELHGLYYSPNIVRVIRSKTMRWVGHLSRRGAEKCLQGFSCEDRRKETAGKTRRRWEDNIKMDLRRIGFGWLLRIESDGELL